MCGISVVLDPESRHDVADRLHRMHEAIPHRGPDGEGFLTVGEKGCARFDTTAELRAPFRLGIAFRRLMIRDLTPAADQPMASPDGALWVAFNGEIYNFRALRGELSTTGWKFRSSGDTEVVLAAYETWGEGCFERLDGMWAVVIVDLRRRRVVASRDRIGIKPLFWARSGGRVYLASEATQIVRARGERPRARAPLVARFLRGGRFPCDGETFFEEIYAVPPGTWFALPLDPGEPGEAPVFRPYWDLSAFRCERLDAPALSYAEAQERLHGLLAEAVASHDVADVRVGSLLSGGLDSSTLVGLRVRADPQRARDLPTFSFGLGDAAPELCELRYVDAMVRRHRLVNHRTTMDAAWLAREAPRVVRALEEPPLAMAPLAQYRVYELCREQGATVVIDGQGADEVLGGYPYHQRALVADRLRAGRWASALRELRAVGRRQQRSVLGVVNDWVGLPLLARLRPARPPWLAAEYGAGERASAPPAGGDPSQVNRTLHRDVRWGNVQVVLGFTDRNAMAHSVEARVPFFDRKVVELAFRLPDHYKVGEGERKRVLRDVARRFVPPEITERPDRLGFGVPEASLLRGGLAAAVQDAVGDGFLAQPAFEPRAARRYVEDFARGRQGDVRGIWRMYALALWAAVFDVSFG